MIISRNAWIVVADGSRATVYENVGEIGEISLKLLKAVDQKHEPGSHAGEGQHKSSTQEYRDPHPAAKHNFLHALIEDLAHDAQANKFSELVLIASPAALGDIRQKIPAALEKKIVKQVSKDYSHMAPNELSKTLMHTTD
jgi:protein required for attachment to host cells